MGEQLHGTYLPFEVKPCHCSPITICDFSMCILDKEVENSLNLSPEPLP